MCSIKSVSEGEISAALAYASGYEILRLANDAFSILLN
jgi:hypothetical protein